MSDCLTIALEPECGAFFCRHQPIEQVGKDFRAFSPGSKYMLLDCGGGTVDIAVHEVLQDNKIKELYKANGGNWGGTKVDDAFWNVMSNILGQDVIKKFRKEHKFEELEILRDLEINKRTITPDLEKKMYFKIPQALLQTFNEVTGNQLQIVLNEHPIYKGKVFVVSDKLQVTPELAMSLYDESRNEIKTRLNELYVYRYCVVYVL